MKIISINVTVRSAVLCMTCIEHEKENILFGIAAGYPKALIPPSPCSKQYSFHINMADLH
jgi:hypothetical protein